MNRISRHRAATCRPSVLIAATVMAAPPGLALSAAQAFAQGSDFVWFETQTDARQYYRSEITGAIIPLHHTDPPYDPADRSMILLPRPPQRNFSDEQQVLDEINFESEQYANQLGVIRDLRFAWRGTRDIKEFGSYLTQTGTIAHQQHDTMFQALIGRAAAEARLTGIAKVVERIRPKLNRDGLMHYLRMMETEQRNIAIETDTLDRLDATQMEAVAIDVLSLGLARAATYIGQVITRSRAGLQVARQQTGVQTAQALERRAANDAVRAAVTEAEKRAVTSAAELRAAQEAAAAANSTVSQTGARAAQAEASMLARQVEVKAAEEAVTVAQRQVGRTGVTATQAKVAAENAGQALALAQREANAARAALSEARDRLTHLGVDAAKTETTAARAAIDQAKARLARAESAVQSAGKESQAALAKSSQAGAEAATARTNLVAANQAEASARSALQGATVEAREASAALSRAQTAASQTTSHLTRAATRHGDNIAGLAEKLGHAQAAAGQLVGNMAQNYSLALNRVATAQGQLATAQVQGLSTTAANNALVAAQRELASATQALATAQQGLTTATAQAAAASAAMNPAKIIGAFFKALRDGKIPLRISDTSLPNRSLGALFDLEAAILGNKLSSDETAIEIGDLTYYSEWRRAFLTWRASLPSNERAELDRIMEEGPEAKAAYAALLSDTVFADNGDTVPEATVAPIGSSDATPIRNAAATPTDEINAPGINPAEPAANGKPVRTAAANDEMGIAPVDLSTGSDGGKSVVRDAPHDLKPEIDTERPATDIAPPPPRKLRRVSQASGAGGDADRGTAIASGGRFQFAAMIPSITFTISAGPLPPPARTSARVASAQTPVATSQTAAAVLSQEQRIERLAAIESIRGSLPSVPAGTVQQPYGIIALDPSEEVRRDVYRQWRHAEAYRLDRRSHEKSRIADQAGPAEAVPEPPQAETRPVATPPYAGVPPVNAISPEPEGKKPALASLARRTPAPVALPQPQPPARQGIAGTYQAVNKASGVTQVIITASGSRLTVTGMGSPISLEQDGPDYYGEGAVLFGKGDHQIRLREQPNGLELFAQHPQGGSFTTLLLP